MSFSHDGKLIACGAEKEITIHHVDSGTKFSELKTDVYAVAWSPKRYHLAYVGGDDHKHVGVVNVNEYDEKANDKPTAGTIGPAAPATTAAAIAAT